MTDYVIAFDVHCAFSEMTVVTGSGKLIRRDRCSTTIPSLVEAILKVRRPRRLTFEEGLRAGLLGRDCVACHHTVNANRRAVPVMAPVRLEYPSDKSSNTSHTSGFTPAARRSSRNPRPASVPTRRCFQKDDQSRAC